MRIGGSRGALTGFVPPAERAGPRGGSPRPAILRPPMRSRLLRLPVAALGLALVVAAAPRAGAEEGAPPPEAPPVGLDQLLKLPDDYGVEAQERGGATASEWRRRFRDARAEVESARQRLERTQSQLEQLAQDSDQWQMAAPGTSNPENSPVSYKLREELRRQRAEVVRAERELKDLEVEANLAGVPEAWRQPER